MAELEIPVKFQTEWAPKLPPASELGTVLAKAGIPWARVGSEAVMEWAQHAQAKLAMRLQAQGVALPPKVAELSGELWGIGWAFAGADTREEMVDAALGAGKQIASILQQAQAVSSIPVVGWVVGAVVSLAEIGVTIWRSEQAKVEAAQDHVIPIRYDQDADVYRGQEFLNVAENDDWTFAFQPFQIGAPESYKLIDPPGAVTRVWSMTGAQEGLGEVPGLGRIYRAWTFNTKMSTKAMRTRNGGFGYESFSTYRPVTVGVGAQLWSRVETDGVQAFAVDRDRLEKMWTEWDEALLPIAYSEVDGERSALRARAIVTPTEILMNAPPMEYRPDVIGETSPGITQRVPSVGAYVRWQLARLRERQLGLLDTIVCAYVSENAPAMKDPTIKDRMMERRKQLLQNEAVHHVDRDAVADPDYRQAIIKAQGEVSFPLKAPTESGGLTKLPGAVPIPLPGTFPAWGDEDEGGSGGLLLLGAAVLGVGGFLLLR